MHDYIRTPVTTSGRIIKCANILLMWNRWMSDMKNLFLPNSQDDPYIKKKEKVDIFGFTKENMDVDDVKSSPTV